MKSQATLSLITLMIITLVPLPISVATPVNHHVPRLYRGTVDYPLPIIFPPDEPLPDWSPLPFMGAYMDSRGINLGSVKKTRVTVCFPDTAPSQIQADNWLAGGMFVTGYDDSLNEIDYGFYTMLTLEHDGSLYLDFGINQTYECLWNPLGGFLYGSLPWTKGIYNATIPIEGVSPSTPITLTTSWDKPYLGWVSWEYTINGVTYLADAQNVTALVEALDPSGNIQPYFYVGSRDLTDPVQFVYWVPYGQAYNFQFGVVSRYNIGHGGWNVLLSYPSYFKDSEWHSVGTARSIGGANTILDYRWFWGGENYEGVSAYYDTLQERRNVKFYYSGSTIGDHNVLWGIPLAPADDGITYVDPPSQNEFATVNPDEGIYQLRIGYTWGDIDTYANATLFKNFIPMYTITNPTFTFGFHDKGLMDALGDPESYAILNASLRLWHNGNKLSQLSQPIHTVSGNYAFMDCFHEISMTYNGELLEGETYTIEYGFSAFEHRAFIDLLVGDYDDYRIQAVRLIRADNYKLTIKTSMVGGGEITGVNVWVDGNQISPSPVTVIVSSEMHTIQVESTFWRYWYKYTFSHWEDGSTNNPRTVPVYSNMTITAYYIREYYGTCPTLFVWNGTDYVYETLLNINAYSDITLQHRIVQPLVKDGAFYKISLRELDEFTSHIDQVKLYAIAINGETHVLNLTKAVHNELGNIRTILLSDDDNRVDLYPTQTINLEFTLPGFDGNIAFFIFEINGHNKKSE